MNSRAATAATTTCSSAARETISSRAAPVPTTFVFGLNHGSDWITDFGDGADVIDLSGLEGISGFDDLHLWSLGTAAVVDLTSQGGGSIWLQDTAVSDLDAADFVFYEPSVDAVPIDGM